MSSYETLATVSGLKSLPLQRIQLIVVEICKPVNGYNPTFRTSIIFRKHIIMSVMNPRANLQTSRRGGSVTSGELYYIRTKLNKDATRMFTWVDTYRV